MLDPAGILSGSLLRNAKIHKKAGKQSVTLVNRLGDLGLEKESAVAMSIERTFPFAFPSIRMVSR